MRTVLIGALFLAIGVSACSSDSPTSATTGTTTTTATTDPVLTDSFSGTVPVGGTVFFPFDVAVYGSVTVTLDSIGGAGVSSTAQMRVSLGTIGADGCTATTSIALATPGTTTQVSMTVAAGTYCVSIADVGNLFAPADFSLSVLHP